MQVADNKGVEVFFKQVLDEMIVPVVFIDRHFMVLYYNRSTSDKVGKYLDMAINEGDNLFSFVPSYLKSTFLHLLEECFFSGQKENRELPVMFHDQDKIWLDITFIPLFDNDRARYMVIQFMDVSWKKLLKDKPHEAKTSKVSRWLNSQLISTISHEFRSPLTSISLNTHLVELYEKKEETAKFKKSLQRIKQSIHFLTTMLEEVSPIGKDMNGRLFCHPVQVNVSAFFKDIAEYAENLTGREIFLQLPEKAMHVMLDPVLLNHICINILSNSVKYSEPGTQVFMRVSGVDTLEISFEDEGPGISPGDKENIFEPFFRGQTAKAKRGTGLGLTVVKRCVDLHGGKVHVKTRKPKGTVFIVCLPLKG